MKVRDVGEFRLIEMLADSIRAVGTRGVDRIGDERFRLQVPLGDDASSWDSPAGPTVLTTDAMVEGVHFKLGSIGWEDLGWKSIAVNLSDIAAMGSMPVCSVITLGLRGDLPVEGLREMYTGMAQACKQYGGSVVGGDTVRSPVLFVSVAMVGAAWPAIGPGGPSPLLKRSAAAPGHLVAVTGSLGCSAGGLRMITDGLRFDDETSAHLVAAHNRPAPRVAEARTIAGVGAGAAIDVSDGLVDDVAKICSASGAGAVLHVDRVPVHDYLRRAYPNDWVTLALTGGEDYELAFTAPPRAMGQIIDSLDTPVAVIGEVVGDRRTVTVVDSRGAEVSVDRGGWDHFAASI